MEDPTMEAGPCLKEAGHQAWEAGMATGAGGALASGEAQPARLNWAGIRQGNEAVAQLFERPNARRWRRDDRELFEVALRQPGVGPSSAEFEKPGDKRHETLLPGTP